ncbi:MAG: hypothetical protein J1E41_06220 [Ruminococcus sp.]|nr:hypothetical protein [Ruminococcus sp.]
MSKNTYTNTVDSIKAPERAVNRMLDTVRNFDNKEKIINMKKFKFKGVVAASLAALVAIGGTIGYNIVTPKNSFVLTVNAAEITETNSAKISTSGANGFSYGEGDNDEVGYCLDLPVNCKGQNIDTVSYSVDTGALSVSYYKNSNPVISGKENNKVINTPETISYTAEDQKYLKEKLKEEEEEHKGENPMTGSYDEYDPAQNYRTKHYSSITLSYDKQLPEGTSISLVGTSTQLSKTEQNYLKEHKDELFNLSGNENLLEAEKVCIDKMLGNQVIHCTIKFKDGSEQSQDIKLGTTIGKFSEINKSDFESIPEKYRADKDFKDVFVTYSLA